MRIRRQTFLHTMGSYVEISIVTPDMELRDILIASLSNGGFEGFEEKDDVLLAYIAEDQFDEHQLDAILSDLRVVAGKTVMGPANWNETWEKNFQPVQIEDFCAIRAGFHPPVSGVRFEIVITPKMSFGTGHHATTYMMILAMQRFDFAGKKVLDFGTGTGVLAVLAEKTGASEILAIDVDANSIENARENLAENHCSVARVARMDSLTGIGRFDVILANLNKLVILSNMALFRQHLTDEGVVLVSGLLTSDMEELAISAEKNGMLLSAGIQRENWICVEMTPIK